MEVKILTNHKDISELPTYPLHNLVNTTTQSTVDFITLRTFLFFAYIILNNKIIMTISLEPFTACL